MRIWGDVYNASGDLIGDGPITNIDSAQITRVLDGIGEISIQVPVADARVQELVTNERRIKLWFYGQDEIARELGTCIVRKLSVDETESGITYALSGPDQLEELRRVNTLLYRQYDGDDLPDVIDDLVGLGSGWSAVTTGSAETAQYARFDGASALKAIQELARINGHHFRLSGDQELTWGPLGDDSGLVIMQAGRSIAPNSNQAETALIKSIAIEDNSEQVANWIIPVGGSTGDLLTLSQASRGVTGGNTLIASSWVENSLLGFRQPGDTVYGSDVTGSGTASASSIVNATYAASKAFDNDFTTTRWQTAAANPTGWIQYDFGVGVTKTITKIEIRPYNNASRAQDPKAFRLDASNNAVTWTTVMPSQTGQSFTQGVSNEYTFSNLTGYRYYRLVITENNGDPDYLIIQEMEWKETTEWGEGPEYLAQSFLGDGSDIQSFSFLMHQVGTLSGYLTVKLYDDNSGEPGSPIADGTSYTVDASNITTSTSGALYPFVFGSHPTLSNGVTYWARLETTDDQSEDDYIAVHYTTNDEYADGEFKTYDGSSWSSDLGDAYFSATLYQSVYSSVEIAGLAVSAYDSKINFRTSPISKHAQSFEGDGRDTAYVDLYLMAVGSPSDNMTVSIYDDNSGEPGNLLGASDTVAETTLNNRMQLIRFPFSTPVTVDDGTTYWLVLTSSGAQSATNYMKIGWDDDSGYTGGQWKYWNTTTSAWVTTGYDLIFSVGATGDVDLYTIQYIIAPNGLSYLPYIEDADSISTYGQIERVVSFDITPLSDDTADIRNAGNALYQAACSWLQRNCVKRTTYSVQLTGVTQTILPGQLVRLIYKGLVYNLQGDLVSWADINDLYWVIRASERWGSDGLTVSLELCDIDAPANDDANAIASMLERVSISEVKRNVVG